MIKFSIHRGHNKNAPGAVAFKGLFSEVELADKLKNNIIYECERIGVCVFDTTDDNGITQTENLYNIVKKCNDKDVDFHISLHFNAFTEKANGMEIWTYPTPSISHKLAPRIISNAKNSMNLSNRGMKTTNKFYVIYKTKKPMLLIECCFLTNADDLKKYNEKDMTVAILNAILKEYTNQVKSYVKIKSKTPLNVRKSAGVEHAVIDTVENGETYLISECKYAKDGALWFYLYNVGWVNGYYLKMI